MNVVLWVLNLLTLGLMFSWAENSTFNRFQRTAFFFLATAVLWGMVVAPFTSDALHAAAGAHFELDRYHVDFFLSLPLQAMEIRLGSMILLRVGDLERSVAWRLFLRGLGTDRVPADPEPEIRVWVDGRSLNVEVSPPPTVGTEDSGRTVV